MTSHSASTTPVVVPGRHVVPILLMAVLVTHCAQQVLMPALAPLARETGLTEIQLGLILSSAASMLAIASPFWGGQCAKRGARAVLLAGLLIGTLGLVLFAIVSSLAMADRLSTTTTFILMIITRGFLFGTAIAAVPVAAIAFVSSITTPEQRTAGVSRVGAAQGLAIVIGPAVGGALAFAGLLGPIWVAPVFAGLALVVVAFGLPRAQTAEPNAPRVSLRPWDRRYRSFLLIGFFLYTGLGLVLLTIGFAVQDRAGLAPDAAVRITGAITFSAGVILAVMQGAVVPRLSWSPERLLLTGLPIAIAGFIIQAIAPTALTLGLGMVCIALGLGLCSPAYVAGTTLRVQPHEQSAVAGLISSVNGLTFVIGPTLGGVLYNISAPVPFAVAAVAASAGMAWLLIERRNHAAAAAPEAPADQPH